MKVSYSLTIRIYWKLHTFLAISFWSTSIWSLLFACGMRQEYHFIILYVDFYYSSIICWKDYAFSSGWSWWSYIKLIDSKHIGLLDSYSMPLTCISILNVPHCLDYSNFVDEKCEFSNYVLSTRNTIIWDTLNIISVCWFLQKKQINSTGNILKTYRNLLRIDHVSKYCLLIHEHIVFSFI